MCEASVDDVRVTYIQSINLSHRGVAYGTLDNCKNG